MYLLDTNVVCELRKVRSKKADPGVAAWAESVDASSLFLSSISLQELEIGVLLAERRDPKKGKVLRAWLATAVLPAFAGRVLSVDSAVALRSAALHVPNPKPFRDAFIAATALVHRMIVVTRDTHDFAQTGVDFFNPWKKN
jgi:toxin FitB